jgi:hypothetical protein
MSNLAANNAQNLLGICFLSLLFLVTCCGMTVILWYLTASCLSAAHDKLDEIRQRREKRLAERLAAVDRVIGQR